MWHLLLLIQIPLSLSKTISIRYILLDGTFTSFFQIGDPIKNKFLVVDINSKINLITKEYYTINREFESKHFINSNSFEFNNEIIPVKKMWDILTFEGQDIKIRDFLFYYCEQKIEKEDSFGLSIHIQDKNMSIIHSLYNKKFINKIQFGFISDPSSKDGKLYFGETPKNFLRSYSEILINVKPGYDNWGFDLEKVIVGNSNEYVHSHYAYFSTTDKRILSPKNFMHFLQKNVLDNYIQQKLCTLHNNITYRCERWVVDTFPPISFVIGETVFTLKGQDLFHLVNRRCSLIFEENLENGDIWQIGSFFISYYPTFFNFETGQIKVYKKNESSIVLYNVDRKREYLNKITILTIIWILLGLTLSVIIFVYKTKYTISLL